jgi:hypothetical protein
MAHWVPISPVRPISGTGQNITVGATSAATATAFGSATFAVYVSTTGNCHLRLGNAPVAVATDMLIKASDPPIMLKVAPGEKIAVIQDGASTGTCNIIEVTH